MAAAPTQPAPPVSADTPAPLSPEGAQDLDAQVEAIVRSAAATADEVRAVVEPEDATGPAEPNLDELVRSATALQAAPGEDDEFVDPSAELAAVLDAQVAAALQVEPATESPPCAAGPGADSQPETGAPAGPVESPPVATGEAEQESADPPAPAPTSLPVPVAATGEPVLAAVAAVPVAVAAPPRDGQPAPEPMQAPAAPAVPVATGPSAAPAKPAGPSWARRVVVVLEEAVEPLALRLGALPKGTRDTIGWVAMGTLFWASVVWVYVLAFAPRGDMTDVDPRTFLPGPARSATAGDGHGEKKGDAKSGQGDGKKESAKKKEKKDDHGSAKQARGKSAGQGAKKEAPGGGH